jgi:hypothetical protein
MSKFNESYDKWQESDWQYSDDNIVRIAKKLNENCLSKNIKNDYDDDSRLCEWDPEDLDYDYEGCRDYCYVRDEHYCNQMSNILCESCKKIIEEEIRFKYNKTKKELNDEIEEIKKQIEYITNKLNLISLQLDNQ